MTTPAINTPNAIIADAYVDCGKVQEGEYPSSEQLVSGIRRLRDLINVYQTQGLKLWVNVDTTVPLTAGTAVYTLGPSGSVDMTKPLRVIQGYYLYTDTNTRRQFSPMSWNDYLSLGQAGTLTSNRGQISQYFVDKQATRLSVTFWQCPDDDEADDGAAHLLLQTQITNPTELDETMNFPEEWRMALRWGLADDLSTGQPQSVIERCKMRAEQFRNALEAWDVEDAPTSFQPDPRSGNAGSAFR